MHLTRSSRSIVAILTACLLLLCQTAGAAYGCFTSPAQQHDASAVSAPCHTATEGGDSTSRQAPSASSCDASQAIAKTASAPVFQPADLPPLLVAVYDPALAMKSLYTPQRLPAICSSPPFTVLHCRFLN